MRAGALTRIVGFLVVSGVAGMLWGGAVSAHRAVGSAALGQTSQPAQPPVGGQSPTMPQGPAAIGQEPNEHDPGRERMRQQAIVSANDARHKRMETDAAKLLELSTELKADVDKAGKDELSLEVIRKADEIEKLAHDVKERMKQ